jgi:hypothetical protein
MAKLDPNVSLGMGNGFHAFVSNRYGKFYVSFVPVNGDVVLGVAIMGPYKTDRQASKISAKWTRLNKRLMDSGQALNFVDMKTVPDDVRAYISACVTEAVTKKIANVGDVFCKAFH